MARVFSIIAVGFLIINLHACEGCKGKTDVKPKVEVKSSGQEKVVEIKESELDVEVGQIQEKGVAVISNLLSCENASIQEDLKSLKEEPPMLDLRIGIVNRVYGACLACGKDLPECKDIDKVVAENLQLVKDPFITPKLATSIMQIHRKQGYGRLSCSIAKKAAEKFQHMETEKTIYCMKDEDQKRFLENVLSESRQMDAVKVQNDLNHFEWLIQLCRYELFWKPDYCAGVEEKYAAFVDKNRPIFNSQHYKQAIFVLSKVIANIDKALELAEEALKKWSDNSEIQDLAADIYSALRMFDKAGEIYETRAKAEPENIALQLRFVDFILENETEFDKAEAIISAIKTDDEGNAYRLKGYKAWLKIRKGDCEGALKALKECPRCKALVKSKGFYKAVYSCEMKSDKGFQQKLKQIEKKKLKFERQQGR